MKNKKWIFAAAALVVVIALMVGIWVATRPQTQEGEKSFTLTVVHGDGSEKSYTVHTEEMYLGAAVVAEGLAVESDSPGLYNTVDGETADWNMNQSYWAFYVGDTMASEGMNTTVITDGAVYKLVYTVG